MKKTPTDGSFTLYVKKLADEKVKTHPSRYTDES
jgi:hypothetical protein